MKNKTKHICITAMIACLLTIGMFSLIGCTTIKATDYLRWGDNHFEKGEYDDAIRWYNWILEEFPKSPEAKIAKEKLANIENIAKEQRAQREAQWKEQQEEWEVQEAAQRKAEQAQLAQQKAEEEARLALQDNSESDFKIELDDKVKNGVVITKYDGSRRVVRIPASIQNYPVTGIGKGAFENSKITDITIPNSVKSIEDFAFAGTSLTSITIPNSVTYLSGFNRTGLTSITIPNSVTSIGNYAFRGCTSLTSITIPNSVTNIGNEAFMGCQKLTSVTIPNSVTIALNDSSAKV